MKKIVPLLCTLWLVCQACDPASSYTYTFENNSSHQVIITGFPQQQLKMAPHTTRIFTGTSMGSYANSKGNEYCPCPEPIALAATDSNLAISKDIRNAGNWARTAKKKLKHGYFSCTFSLADTDFTQR